VQDATPVLQPTENKHSWYKLSMAGWDSVRREGCGLYDAQVVSMFLGELRCSLEEYYGMHYLLEPLQSLWINKEADPNQRREDPYGYDARNQDEIDKDAFDVLMSAWAQYQVLSTGGGAPWPLDWRLRDKRHPDPGDVPGSATDDGRSLPRGIVADDCAWYVRSSQAECPGWAWHSGRTPTWVLVLADLVDTLSCCATIRAASTRAAATRAAAVAAACIEIMELLLPAIRSRVLGRNDPLQVTGLQPSLCH
jgi:hypothetical protein